MWHRNFITADVTAEFVNNQHAIQRRRENFDKKFVFEGVHTAQHGCTAKRLTDEFLEKSWTQRDVNKLLKKLRDTATKHYHTPPNATTQLALFTTTQILLKKTMPSYA